jgi:hypothetical protein
MKINEVIVREDRIILDEGIKDTLKKIGLGALLSVSLAGPAQALDNLKMDDLIKMGMTQEQATEIVKMPAQTKGEVVQRFEKKVDNPKVTQQVEKIKAAQAEPNKSVEVDSKKVDAVMKDIIKLDPSIVSYNLKGGELTIIIDSKIKKGYENFLKVQKKGYWKDFNHSDALDYYGFNNSYADSVKEKLPGIENVNFEIDSKLESSKEKIKVSPELSEVVQKIKNAVNVGNTKQACFYLDQAKFIATEQGNTAAYEKFSSMQQNKALGC